MSTTTNGNQRGTQGRPPVTDDPRRNDGPFAFEATEATREGVILRAAFCGPTGSGKTTTALVVATRMAEKLDLGPVHVIDTENRSALKYAYSPRTKLGFRFKHVAMPTDDYSPESYMRAIDFCEAQGAGVIVIDSLSHAWNGIGGVLESVDDITARSRSKNTFGEGWKAMTPIQNRLVQRIHEGGVHTLYTLRAKQAYVMVENDRGKQEPRKVGLAPVQREGIDYEPDLFFEMGVPDNDLIVAKTRCDRLAMGETIRRPGVDFADILIEWIRDTDTSGAEPRSLGEALTQAVNEGIRAGEERNPNGYTAATKKLVAFCKRTGVSEDRYNIAQAQMKERVASHLGAHRTEDPPPNPRKPAEPIEVAMGREPGSDDK